MGDRSRMRIEPGDKQRRRDNSYGKRRGGSHLIKSDQKISHSSF